MDSAWTSIIVFVLSVFVLIFFVGQAFFAGGEKVTTETAFTYSMTEDIPFEGVFLRDETVIHNSGTGVVDYEHSDGSKVGKSSVIARRYRSEADIERRSEIEKINEQIAVLTDAQRLAGTDNNQLETISSQINERHSLILESLIDGDYSSAQAQENAMLGVLSKREISRGDIASYESKISSLRSRASQLEAMLSGDVQDIEAGGAGYFVSSVDGYEDKLSIEDSTTITADRIEEILDKPDLGSSSSEVGKLIADYRWRVAAVMDSSQLFGCNEGGEVTLRVSSDRPDLRRGGVDNRFRPRRRNRRIRFRVRYADRFGGVRTHRAVQVHREQLRRSENIKERSALYRRRCARSFHRAGRQACVQKGQR